MRTRNATWMDFSGVSSKVLCNALRGSWPLVPVSRSDRLSRWFKRSLSNPSPPRISQVSCKPLAARLSRVWK
ncbi:hypothetical protein D3C85_1245480 [compost metagenome]